MLSRTITSLVFVCLAAGCSIKNVHLERPPAGAVVANLRDKARIFVVRPSIVGWVVPYPITINGVFVGNINSHDYVEALVPEGNVRIEARAETRCEMVFPVEGGHAYYILAATKMGWVYNRVQLELLSPEEGSEMAAGCESRTEPNVVIREPFVGSAEPN